MIMCLFCYLEQFNYSPKPIPGIMWVGGLVSCVILETHVQSRLRNVEKKNGKGVRYSSSKDPSNTHTKHLLSKMTPLEVIKCYLFKTNQYVRVCLFSLKIDNIS